VDVIVGPGNQYVAEAKRQVMGRGRIDMLAGPSEVLIIADATANPEYIAADMLAQAEHDEQALAVLITTSDEVADQTVRALERQVKQLARHDIAMASLQENGAVLIVRDLDDAIEALENTDSKRVLTSYREPIERDVVFVFSGQGSQYVNMGKGLYRSEPIFKKQVDRCSKIMKEHLDLDLRDILYPSDKDVEESERLLQQTHITQPVLFIIEYAFPSRFG